MVLSCHRGRPTGVLVLLVAQSGEDPTDLEKRRRVFLTVNRYPGLTLARLAREADVDESLARYHVRILEDAKLVRSEEEGGHRRIFPLEKTKAGARDPLDERDRQWLALLRRPPILRAVVALLHEEPMNAGGLAEACGVSRSTASHHISRMEEGEIVAIEREGRSRMISLADRERVVGLLAEHPPPPDMVQGFIEAWDDLGL
jgi:DNA-binding transcriptional ArsR family regulator